MKNLASTISRIYKTSNGLTQWYAGKASIAGQQLFPYKNDIRFLENEIAVKYFETSSSNTSFYISADTSLWNESVGPAGSFTPAGWLPINISWTRSIGSYFWMRFNLNVRLGDEIFMQDSLSHKLWVNGAAQGGADVVSLDPWVGTTIAIAIQYVDGGGSQFAGFRILNSVGVASNDMNPAHIIRECLTDKTWGLGYDTSDIDDTSFTACANTLYDEQFGLSLLWSQETSLNDFIGLILSHIEASLYISRDTGKFVLKLVRADYNVDNLLTLDDSNISSIEAFKRKSSAELINQVTVTFEDSKTSEPNSVTVHNLALIQQQGVTISESYEFVGISNMALATRVASRELRAASTPTISCTLYCNREANALNVGDVFKLTVNRYGLSQVVMRVGNIEFGDIGNNVIKIDCVQDVFGVDKTIYLPAQSEWESPLSDPQNVTTFKMYESPYWDLVQTLGEANAQVADALIGYASIAIVAPAEGQYSAYIYNVVEGAYTESEAMDFCPTALLNGAMAITDTTVTIDNADNISSVRIGSYCIIDDEIMRVDSVSDTTMTVGRGCLDTVRVAHADNARIYFADDYISSDGVEYLDNETVSYKIVTLAGNGQLPIESATAKTVTMNQRQYRAYPPAKLTLNTLSYPASITATENLVVAWAHRNRLQQTATIIDDIENSITPESGTAYTIELRTLAGTLISSQTGITGTTHTFTTATMGANYGQLRVLLWSVRDSLDSFQKHDYTFTRLAP